MPKPLSSQQKQTVCLLLARRFSHSDIAKRLGVHVKSVWRIANLQKRRAQEQVGRAIATKKIKKPKACEQCGKIGYVEAHHSDYTKPLGVKWLCKKCHWDEHRPKRPRKPNSPKLLREYMSEIGKRGGRSGSRQNKKRAGCARMAQQYSLLARLAEVHGQKSQAALYRAKSADYKERAAFMFSPPAHGEDRKT